jgi:transposase-like protein
MHCPKCKSGAFSKNGFKVKKQRYKCKECGCNFTQSHKPGYEDKWRELAVLLYVYGLSMNAIARLLGISHQTIALSNFICRFYRRLKLDVVLYF